MNIGYQLVIYFATCFPDVLWSVGLSRDYEKVISYSECFDLNSYACVRNKNIFQLCKSLELVGMCISPVKWDL